MFKKKKILMNSLSVRRTTLNAVQIKYHGKSVKPQNNRALGRKVKR